MVSDDQPPYEIILEMPEFLNGPILLPNGDVVDVDDLVEHISLGQGKVIRISTYHDDLGILLFVEFPGNRYEKLCLDVVKKVTPSCEKSPGGGSLSAT